LSIDHSARIAIIGWTAAARRPDEMPAEHGDEERRPAEPQRKS
jgi:hypothetical protein